MPEISDARSDPLPPLREVIAAHGLAAKKSLGQNFLLDLNLTRKIARAAGPLDDSTIYEVGPGPGGLTRALLMEGARRVVAIERDARCLPALDEIAAAFPGRLEIISDDALKIDETKFLRTPVRIAANLPYNIGSALLVKWLTSETWPPFWQSATLMFQREVAQRIVAPPGSKSYGRLSVLAQWRTHAKTVFDVSPRAFTPPPKVTSSIVRLEPLAEPVAPALLHDLEAVTAAAFGQRRKMLRQSLKSLTPDTEDFIRAAGLDPTQRAEQLSVADFAALARQLRAR
jgi:16S rRNA (adenine1518-N6/adenine1519-N6)-dimethyltransferase